MSAKGYARFCPTAMACSILEPRWTMLILCELWNGATRFNQIHGGLPGMSPSLLSRRLREMRRNGLVVRHAGAGGQASYTTSAMADELEPLVMGLGEWAHRNIDPALALESPDHRALMWNIRRKIDARALPRRRAVVEFILGAAEGGEHRYWLLIRPNAETDLCSVDPRHEVDLFVVADLAALASAWIGHSSFAREISAGRIALVGDAAMAASLEKWMVRSSFAGGGAAAGRLSGRPAARAARAAE